MCRTLAKFDIQQAQLLSRAIIDEDGGLRLNVLVKPLIPATKQTMRVSVRLEMKIVDDESGEHWKIG